jgi:hypothetical protein
LQFSLQGKGFALELRGAFLGLRHLGRHVDPSLVDLSAFVGVRGIGLFQRQAPDDGEHLVGLGDQRFREIGVGTAGHEPVGHLFAPVGNHPLDDLGATLAANQLVDRFE